MLNKARIRWIFFDIGKTLVDESKPIRDVVPFELINIFRGK
jgi:FMN phosphatase YigB (HAD superfamily)